MMTRSGFLLQTGDLLRGAGQITTLVGALWLLPLSAAKLDAQAVKERSTSAKRTARAVHLHIDTDRARYRVGDSIRVRVSFFNTSNERILFFPQGPAQDAELIVWGEDGQAVKPTGQKAPPVSTSGMPQGLDPHKRVPWGWKNDEWMYLSNWGYQLREPGRYTIRGLPRLGYPELEPDNRTVRSNTVTITITP
jgi:hypothetical protein